MRDSKFNFIKPSYSRESRKFKIWLKLSFLLLVVLIIFFLLIYSYEFREIKFLKKESEKLKSELLNLESTVKEKNDLINEKNKLEKELKIKEKNNKFISKYFLEISHLIPNDIALRQLGFLSKENLIILHAISLSDDSVKNFLELLSKSNYFNSVKIKFFKSLENLELVKDLNLVQKDNLFEFQFELILK